MTIEREIDILPSGLGLPSITYWLWTGSTHSFSVDVDCCGFPDTYGGSVISKHLYNVNKLIKKASLAECLTSSSEYIREYKKNKELDNDNSR